MWSNPQFPMDLITFTAGIPNGKLNFLWNYLYKCLIIVSIKTLVISITSIADYFRRKAKIGKRKDRKAKIGKRKGRKAKIGKRKDRKAKIGKRKGRGWEPLQVLIGLLVQSQRQWKHQNNLWNFFNVNYDVRIFGCDAINDILFCRSRQLLHGIMESKFDCVSCSMVSWNRNLIGIGSQWGKV